MPITEPICSLNLLAELVFAAGVLMALYNHRKIKRADTSTATQGQLNLWRQRAIMTALIGLAVWLGIGLSKPAAIPCEYDWLDWVVKTIFD